jgi:hypothetical protein
MRSPVDARYAQLFLDEEIIEQTVRLQRVVHQPHKYYGNPVYTVGAPWEGAGVVYLGGVYIDPADAVWKAWYVSLYPPAYPEITYAVCMITSRDGFRWERPALDVYRGHDGEPTNIVLELGKVGGTGAPTILHEPKNDAEPWTMIISSQGTNAGEYKGYVLRSADGVHWRWECEMPNGVPHGMHDRCTAMKGPDPEYPYVLMSRGSEDMSRWGLPRVAHRRAINAQRAQQGEPTRVIVPDLEDDPAGQIYHAYAFQYEDIYVGMFQWFWETNDPYGEMELIMSRDTVTWKRIRPRRIFLPRSPGGGALGAFDCQVTDAGLSPPVRTGQGGRDTLWFYYWGGAAMHGNRHLTFGRGIGMAQLRADGFCSLRASRFPGTLVTKPFVWPGGRLLINASCLGGSHEGSLRTEVLTSDLKPISGLCREDAERVGNDGTSMEQTWKQDPRAIARLKGETIRLKFYLDNYDLFSFRASGQ